MFSLQDPMSHVMYLFVYIANSCKIYMERGTKVKFTLRYAIVIVYGQREWEGETLNKNRKQKSISNYAVL